MAFDYPLIARVLLAAKPPKKLRSQKFYHGTKKASSAERIWKDGILPDLSETPKTNVSRPVAGRVYLTQKLSEAIPYMLGGAFAGSEFPREFMRGEPFGFMFVVNGSDLSDIQPDEDQVGQAVYDKAFPWLERYLDILRLKLPEIDSEDEDVVDYRFQSLLEQVNAGEYVAWIRAGHYLLPHLNNKEKLDVIKKYGNIANEGKIMPVEMWRFRKDYSPDLKHDGSNFFELAQLVEKR